MWVRNAKANAAMYSCWISSPKKLLLLDNNTMTSKAHALGRAV